MSYARARQFSTKMIRSKGQKISWMKSTKIVSDSSKPWDVSTASTTTYTPYAIVVPLRTEGRGRVGLETNTYVKGTDIPGGALMAYMEPVAFTPEINDIVIVGGVEMKLRNFDAYDPDGSGAIIYVLELIK